MLTQERLKELFTYDPETGIFKRKVSVQGGGPAGTIAGHKPANWYNRIVVDGTQYNAHRLAFLFMEGYFPEYQVDHIDGDKSNNTWKNLRHVTPSCNSQNQKKYSNNTSGFPGVSVQKKTGKWLSQAFKDKKVISLGLSDSALEAALVRLTWEVSCESWKCNHRGELVKAIKNEWPEFNEKSLWRV